MTALLVLGGARSGKSRLAEAIVMRSGLGRTYLATATAGDAEMMARIAEHRSRRDGQGWETVEEPMALEAALRARAGEGTAILVDCLTLWLSNIMLSGADVDRRTKELSGTLADLPGLTVFVSNEVGLGLIPETPLGRRFRDAQGRLNQAIAAAADRVLFVAAGLPIAIKGPAWT